MIGTCARCGQEKAGEHYTLYFWKQKAESGRIVYSDPGYEKIFLCDHCALSESRNTKWVLLVVCAMTGLLFGSLFVLGLVNYEPSGAGITAVMGVLMLACLAPIYWLVKGLRWRAVKKEDGEKSALNLRAREYISKGYASTTGTGFDQAAATVGMFRQWKNAFLMQSEQQIIPADVTAIRQYTHLLALEWWKTHEGPVICDKCNGPVGRDQGYLVGSYLHCESCGSEDFGSDAITYLREDPNFFGRGVLEHARAMMAEKYNALLQKQG